MTATMTAEVFKSGKSQAIRLPQGYRFKSKTVQVVQNGPDITLIAPAALARRRRAARELWGSCPDFPDVR
jgi:virulence-associated protein VagC